MTQPRVGCGAAIVRDEKILLLRRLRPPEAGCWGLPGGKVDWLEPVAGAVARELAEELGIRVTAKTLLCVADQIDAAGNEHWVAPIYLVTEFEGTPRLLEPDKHAALAWFPLSALPTPLTAATHTAVAALAG
jgi:8-oxo-dGTP diphosphatase